MVINVEYKLKGTKLEFQLEGTKLKSQKLKGLNCNKLDQIVF